MHPAIWDTGLDAFVTRCEDYRDLITREHDCELCEQKVHSVDRHIRNCVVLFQVALATAWHQVGRPEQDPTQDVTHQSFRPSVVASVLQEPMIPAQDEEKPLLKILERHCGLCSCSLTNQQDWKRHMAKVHAEAWRESQEARLAEVNGVALARPCKFCRTTYTKTPRVHAGRCLPLLQLVFLDQHGNRRTGNGADRVAMGDQLSDAGGRPIRRRGAGEHPETQSTVPRSRGDERTVKRQRERVPRPAPVTRQHQTNQLVGLAKIMARHEAALQLLQSDRSWIMLMDSGDLGSPSNSSRQRPPGRRAAPRERATVA